jgi:hypothetical protein
MESLITVGIVEGIKQVYQELTAYSFASEIVSKALDSFVVRLGIVLGSIVLLGLIWGQIQRIYKLHRLGLNVIVLSVWSLWVWRVLP